MIYLVVLAAFYLGGVLVAFTDLEFEQEPEEGVEHLVAGMIALAWPLALVVELRYRWRRKDRV